MVTINIGRQEAVFFGVIILVFLLVGFSVAFSSGYSPEVMGHSFDEVENSENVRDYNDENELSGSFDVSPGEGLILEFPGSAYAFGECIFQSLSSSYTNIMSLRFAFVDDNVYVEDKTTTTWDATSPGDKLRVESTSDDAYCDLNSCRYVYSCYGYDLYPAVLSSG